MVREQYFNKAVKNLREKRFRQEGGKRKKSKEKEEVICVVFPKS